MSENLTFIQKNFSQAKVSSGPIPFDATPEHVLDRVSSVLAETGLKLDDVLQSVARLLAGMIGDVCFIRLLSPDGTKLEPCGFYAIDPAAGKRALELFSASALSIDDGVSGRCVRERKTMRFSFSSAEDARKNCASRYHDEVQKFGVTGVIAAPLICRDRVTGTIVLVRCGFRTPYSQENENLLRGVAERAAITIENSRLYEEVRRAKDEASELATRLQLLSDAVPALIAYIDSSFIYRFVNASYERIFLLPRDKIIGRHMSEVVRPQSFAVLEPKVTEALTGKTVKFESEFTLKSGEKRILEITYVPSQQGGEVKGVFALTHDVTERKHAELALKQNIEEMTRARAEAEKARQFAEAGNRAKDLFLATLSHELRTPLTTILSYAQMLRMGILSQDKARKGIEMIEQSAMTQAQLINDLLDISRITMGKLVLNLKEVDPVAVLRTTIESIRPQLEQKSLRIETQITPLASAVVADAVRLKQIYLNLLTNAIKFSNTGGVIEVKLDTVTENSIEYFRVSVADHGKGIHPEFLPHIFDRFRQADNSITRTHGGMGLGLAIVRALTEQHGGSALAESEGEGLGATLSIQIPLKSQQTHQDHGAIISSSALVPDSPSSMAAAIRLDGLKIVLVDDDKSARESLALLLTSLGAEVRAASSASQGYQRVLESKPDVLVSDIGMPGEDGYSLMAKVRALGLHQGGLVPSIALTAFAGIEDMQRALAAGFQAHLAKPVNASSLAKTIVGLLDPTRSSGLNH